MWMFIYDSVFASLPQCESMSEFVTFKKKWSWKDQVEETDEPATLLFDG